MRNKGTDGTRKPWPKACLWPEPYWDGMGGFWDLDLAEMLDLDEEGEDLLDIKAYMDGLVECGRLNSDYSLNEDYEEDEEETGKADEYDEEADNESEADDDCDEFVPDIGADYWDDGFDIEAWEEALSDHINLLKIEVCNSETDPVSFVREVTGYTFINENILRQAFTRRAFGLEYGLGDCEELEFYGDSVLNMVVSHELCRRFSDPYIFTVEKPFQSQYSAGDLSTMRTKFICRDHLAARAAALGLDRYILYGTGEEASDAAREDMMEALIGAVAVDSDWDWSLLADVVDRLICLQLEKPDELVKKSAYEQLNSWHQKHFGCLPEYIVDWNRRIHGKEYYYCTLKYRVPENDKNIRTSQRIDVSDFPTRTMVREYAADRAVRFLMNNGLWMRLDDAHITPEFENSINQLQELYQKKYVGKAVYSFEEDDLGWYCNCIVDSIEGWGRAAGKTKAKKKAAFMALVRMYRSAGLSTPELEKAMWETEAINIPAEYWDRTRPSGRI